MSSVRIVTGVVAQPAEQVEHLGELAALQRGHAEARGVEVGGGLRGDGPTVVGEDG